jgi:uncharacterized protein (TIGR03437 family)
MAQFDTNPRTGTFVTGIRTVALRLDIGGLPVNSAYRVRFLRPNDTVGYEFSNNFGNTNFIPSSIYYRNYNPNFDVTGQWRLVFDINGKTLFEAPLTVVASANQIVNRPPNPISVAFDPPSPTASDVVFCRVQSSLVFRDPDYDIVRYRYQWRVNGNIVRDVTSAGMADAIPHDTARNGDTLTCTVTPSDGQVPGLSTTALVRVGTAAVANVSAASYTNTELAAESVIAAFGSRLATTTQVADTLPLPTQLSGTTVRVRDSAGVERLAPLFFVAPSQINYQLPPGTAPGLATITIISSDGIASVGGEVARVVPGLFTANASGQGVPAAIALRVRADGSQSYEPVAQFDTAQNRFVPAPLALGPESDQLFLILYGTGLRFNNGLNSVLASLGGVNAEVFYAGAQGDFVGLDQVNLRIPRSLAGRGEIEAALVVSTKTANPVRINIR